jgi:hypothetical protein
MVHDDHIKDGRCWRCALTHLRKEGQSCEEGALLLTRCGLTVPRKETAWDALEAALATPLVGSVRPEVCRECLDAEVSELIRQIHSLTIRLVGYRKYFYGCKRREDNE